ncbi:hypothetical protein tb265_41870 [Gemmatimonadetes bacterium T265]|nr:hypothetical protein tb265_41870 [Gemmatimonadetes bacterium T265]
MYRSRRIARAFGAALVGLGALAPAACNRPDGRGADVRSGPPASGQQLAARYCQSCHILPTPGLLDTASWDQWVLPRMARRLGLTGVGDPTHLERIEGGVAGELVREAHVFPDSALISRAEWDRLAAYYLRGAPAVLPRAATPPVVVGLPGFRVRVPDFHVANPMVTLVHVDAAHGRTYIGDANPGRSTLAVLDARGRPVQSYPLPSPVANLRVAGDTLGLVFMGRLDPSDVPRGSLAVIPSWHPGAAPTIAWEVDTLRRPVFASYADLNGDGREDAVVSEFGNLTGRLAWYERLPNGGSRRHPLTAEPGAMNTVVRDFDGDGRPDILALNAQADEGVSLFHSRPNGQFVREWLLRFPPSYGSSSMELADVDGDGYPDIVYTNGDNGDYPSPPKPYHGIHVFLNDGHWHFAEKYFFPMPGAYKAIARDFDGDGKVDIAAIAFYPDYTAPAPLPFVFLHGLGGMRFEARTFPDANRGRWLTMDAGDVNGDGRDDLVLGAFAAMGAPGDRSGLAARWHRPDAPTVLILENTSTRAGAPSSARRTRPALGTR